MKNKQQNTDNYLGPGTAVIGVKILVVLTYLGMITVNGLASALPINGQTTGAVSDAYPNLFAPAGVTFAIWGLIYLLLAGYAVYQLILPGAKWDLQGGKHKEAGSRKEEGTLKEAGSTLLLTKIGLLFSLSSLINGAWIFAWHYHRLALSLLLMLLLLALLAFINLTLAAQRFTFKEKLLVRLPFSVYFGWITVAAIANVTTLLVRVGWDGFGLPDQTWTVIIILVGMIISLAALLRFRDRAYGLVIIWAYLGIWLKHSGTGVFAGQYPAVLYTAAAAMAVLAGAVILMTIRQRAGEAG